MKHGLAKQPSIKSTGVKNPSSAKDLPDLPKAKDIPLRSQTKPEEPILPDMPTLESFKVPGLFKPVGGAR